MKGFCRDEGSRNGAIGDIFGERQFVMGMAMLWIMAFHADFSVRTAVGRMIKIYGYTGADIFLLCSGFGCFCSLEKDPDAVTFIRRRAARILPAWLVFMAVWLPAARCLHDLPVRAMVGNLLGVQTFTALWEKSFNWYIGAMWLFYFLAPYLHGICRSSSLRKNTLVLGILMVMAFPFWDTNNLIICITRLPVCYLGMMLAKYSAKPLNRRTRAAAAAGIVPAYVLLELVGRTAPELLWSRGLYWQPLILAVFGLCLLLYQTARCMRKAVPILYKLICRIGRCSFECYLIHILINDVVSVLISNQRFPRSKLTASVAAMASIVLAMCFERTLAHAMVLMKRNRAVPKINP